MRNLVAVFYINWSLAFFNLCVIWLFFCGFVVFFEQATCNLQVPSCGCSQNAASWCINKIYSYIYKYTYTHLPAHTNTLIPMLLHIQIHPKLPPTHTYIQNNRYIHKLHILLRRHPSCYKFIPKRNTFLLKTKAIAFKFWIPNCNSIAYFSACIFL